MKRKLLTIAMVCFSVIINKSYSQNREGYVVFKNNDTVKADFKRNVFTHQDSYKIRGHEDYKAVDLKDIKEYSPSYADGPLVAKEIPAPFKSIQFLSLIEKGTVNLYEYRFSDTKTPFTVVIYYAAKGKNDSLVQVKNNQWVMLGLRSKTEEMRSLDRLIADDPSARSILSEKKKLNLKEVRSLIHSYNSKKL